MYLIGQRYIYVYGFFFRHMTGYRGDKIKLFNIQALVGMLKYKF